MKRPRPIGEAHRRRGATMVEYALMAALISVVAIAAMLGTRSTFESGWDWARGGFRAASETTVQTVVLHLEVPVQRSADETAIERADRLRQAVSEALREVQLEGDVYILLADLDE